MSQPRLSLWGDEGPSAVPAKWAHVAPKPFDPERHCAPCYGSGWGDFIAVGGRVCRVCMGSGKKQRAVKLERIVLE